MDSIVEDDDGSSSGDYTPENSVVNQLLSSMGAGGNAEMLRLIASNRLGNTRCNGTASAAGSSVAVATASGGGSHQSSRSTYFKRLPFCMHHKLIKPIFDLTMQNTFGLVF